MFNIVLRKLPRHHGEVTIFTVHIKNHMYTVRTKSSNVYTFVQQHYSPPPPSSIEFGQTDTHVVFVFRHVFMHCSYTVV